MKKHEISELPVRKIRVDNYEFVVENYSGRKGIGVGNPISSEEFELCGHRWVIQFFPEGQDAASHEGGFASAHISLRSESTEAEPVQVLTDLFVADQLGKGKRYGNSSFLNKQVSYLRHRGTTGRSDFISRAKLESPDSGFLKDDSLKFLISIGVFTYHSLRQRHVVGSSVDFVRLFDWQWNDEFAFFHVAHKTFCAAKSILAARCRVLLSHLPDERHLQDAVIPDVEPDIFAALLWFVYNGTIYILYQNAIRDSDPKNLESFAAKLLRAAHRFELKGLKEICELSISEKVSCESVASLLHLADVCNAAKLKSACLLFAAQNQSAVMDSDGYKYLKETCPSLFLDLAGFGDTSSYQDYTSTSREGVLNTCNRIVSTVRESLVIRRWSWDSPYMKHKIKEF